MKRAPLPRGRFEEIGIGIRQGLSEMSFNFRRSVLSIFSIMMGVGSVMLITSLTRGSQDQTVRQIERMGGAEVMTVERVPPRNQDQAALFSRSPGLRYGQFRDLVQKVPELEYLLPQSGMWNSVLSAQRLKRRAHVLAVGNDYFPHFDLASSSFGDSAALAKEWERGGKVCMLGDDIAADLFASGALSSKVLEFRGIKLRVAGIVSVTEKHDWRRKAVFVPWNMYLGQIAGPNAKVEKMMIKVHDVSGMERAVKDVDALLLKAHRGVRDFTIRTPEEELAARAKAGSILSLVGGFIASMAMAVGGIGILNLMWSSVNNRMREIGIRKAIGASRVTILWQFLTESVTIAFTGTGLGLMFGLVPGLIPAGLLPIAPRQALSDFLIFGFTGTAIGLVAGIYPALLAAKLSPVESLSYV